MEPTLRAGDYVLVNRWAFRRRPPAAGDLVVLRDPEGGGYLVKRVRGVTSAGTVFVVGDNEGRSRDSRHFGAVDRGRIVGRVWTAVRR